MQVNNPAKFAILVLTIVCVSELMAVNTITPGDGMPFLAAAFAYALGNGVAAKKHEPQEPMFTAPPTDEEEDDSSHVK